MDLNDIHYLAHAFPWAMYHDGRCINTELARAFNFKRGFEVGTVSELEKRYNIKQLNFNTIMCADNILISFNYDHVGKYLMFLVRGDEVFEYRDHKNEPWINFTEFKSFEGLNAVHVAQEFCKGRIDDSLKKVTEGFSFDSFILFKERGERQKNTD